MITNCKVYVRNVYGQPKVYPYNECAERFAAIAGVKTFSHGQLQLIEKLGFTILVVKDPQNTIFGSEAAA